VVVLALGALVPTTLVGAAGRLPVPAHLARATSTGLPAAASASLPAATSAAASSTGPASIVPTGAADGKTLSILPAGNNGMFDLGQLVRYELTGARPFGNQDQLAPYEALPYASDVSDASLGEYYFPETFRLPADQVVRVQRPDPSVPVTIRWNEQDVPYVDGATLGAAAFGLGYAQAETHLFEMDVLRHYGEGDLSSFVGPSCADEAMDQSQLLYSATTKAQRRAEIAALPKEFPQHHLGADTVVALDRYVAGINAYIEQTRLDPNLLPADYLAIGKLPTLWSPTAVAAIGSIIGNQLGSGGGSGMANAGLWEYLDARYGASDATAIFDAFKEQNDPAAPTTIVGKSFPYMDHGADAPTADNVLPTDALAPLSGAPTSTTPGCDLSTSSPQSLPAALAPYLASLPGQVATVVEGALPTLERAVRQLVDNLAIGLWFPTVDSNALVVDASHSASGHPIAVFGPQVAYWAPEILTEEVWQAPGFAAAGVGFPGTGLVELGRGLDYAWSATSAGTQQIDTKAVQICNPSGGAPAPQGTDYLLDGRCVAMREETFTETATPTPGGLGLPVVISHHIYFADGGIVQGWTTADGHPVAIAQVRSDYGRVLDNAVGFLALDSYRVTTGVRAFMHDVGAMNLTFNWFYVGPHNAGYYQSGADPTRPTGFDPNFPEVGGSATAFTGLLSFAAHPHQVNPPDGYFVSWNNKPAPQFSASDSEFAYGPVYRSQMLVTNLQRELKAHHGRVDRADVVAAMATTATQDMTGLTVWPTLDAADPHPATADDATLLDMLTAWVQAGAHRIQAVPGQGQYRDAAAVAISDQLFPTLTVALFGPIFGGDGVQTEAGGTPTGFTAFPQMGFVNAPGPEGSAYDGGWEGYVVKLLDQLAGIPVAQPFPPAVLDHVCGADGLASCPAAIDQALAETWTALVQANGGDADPSTWTADATSAASHESIPTLDEIQFDTVGIVGQPAIPWQNRPTFQQVAEFPDGR
jgi:acyl-homoserine lactone acylase PvdQ